MNWMAAELGVRVLVVGGTVSYLSGVLAMGAFLLSSGCSAAALTCAVLITALIPAVGYMMVPGRGAATAVLVFLILHTSLSIDVVDYGTLACVSHALLAAAVLCLAKLTDGDDYRFGFIRGTFVFFVGFLFTAADWVSRMCFLLVMVLAATLFVLDRDLKGLDRPRMSTAAALSTRVDDKSSFTNVLIS